MAALRVRPFRNSDAVATARLFFEAVRVGAQSDYDEAQRHAWAPRVPETSAWLDRIKQQFAVVAEEDGVVVGFMTMTEDGCIDLAFVAPDCIGQGIAKQLYDAIHSQAVDRGFTRLHTDASYLARRFFERQGWSVVKQQTVTRGDVSLINFQMEKHLP